VDGEKDEGGLMRVPVLPWYGVRIRLETDGRWTCTFGPGYAFASQFTDLASLFKKMGCSIWVGKPYKRKSLKTLQTKKGSICFRSKNAVGTFKGGGVKSVFQMYWFYDWVVVCRASYCTYWLKTDTKLYSNVSHMVY